MSGIKLEVCVDDADGLYAAIEGGADRIELCAALSVGGLTPNPGLMALAGPPAVPVYAMIRPRPGDFVFSAADLDVMRRDIDAARAAGLAGVVLGASLAGGRLDTSMLTKLTGHAAGLGMTLHRAFDLVPDFAEAMEVAVELGFERILTSGGARSAPQAADQLAEIVSLAKGRLSVMPGSGVTLETVDALLDRLTVGEVHSSCSVREPAQDQRMVDMGFVSADRRRTDVATVRAMKAKLSQR
ncbi:MULTISPECIES: copper homeostasis protein CutC [unclassified Ensifer]|uniref:copper homeostasis protein CutC n=1 Tax=unclassified Ensifer TaxID=2633371 RepID=UPI000813AC9F|nr:MULTISPECIES: copper homeostasis protein CutC [unclassified Ensifer]OCO98740.1 copper homeostasis protein CutC [Ensifer sp. LC14]OCP13219.1 copper homeostasis protein CutC [Ensifer sp. LC13]OCP13822.1 copper homeostasis protein CutC [Ensifer sp. LC11]OCP28200.1 copper homeostasis protein CutC [Ensifer sp. LC499]